MRVSFLGLKIEAAVSRNSIADWEPADEHPRRLVVEVLMDKKRKVTLHATVMNREPVGAPWNFHILGAGRTPGPQPESNNQDCGTGF
jgi:hypothetical protein